MSGLQASIDKMRRDDVGDAAVQAFADAYERLREGTGARLPLVLMNSFSTREPSLEALARYDDVEADVPLDFVQNKVPKLLADVYTVFAKTDPSAGHAGISAFVVPGNAPGFEVGRIEPKMGIKGSTTGEIFFSDCRVPADSLLGEEGDGFRIAMRVLDRSRPGIGAQGLGLAQGATDYALEYAKSRETMGKPIAEHQLVAATLADMETRCEAARGLLYKCGAMIDDGIEGQELTKISAMAKLYCTDVAMDVTTDAVQVLGGYGYMQEYPVERMMRDAKITQIYEGTNQIQRLVMAREMVREANRAFLLPGVG